MNQYSVGWVLKKTGKTVGQKDQKIWSEGPGRGMFARSLEGWIITNMLNFLPEDQLQLSDTALP